jgi:hypothetical protein
LAFVGSIKSENELQDISYRSIRTRVNNFKDSGSWPTGSHPFGYGKACYSSDGRLLWVWQPIDRCKGQVFLPGPDGTLNPGPKDVKIPRKCNHDIIKLVPSNNPDSIRAVKLIFDLYTRVGLSRRQISARLNKEGLLLNGRPFSFWGITIILRNPAYVGDTHFGKVQSGEIHTFDPKGLITKVKRKREKLERDPSERLIKRDTHEPLIDRKTWELAQQKLASEQERTSYAPRNPAYYLKQLFVCGHCGKNLAGRTETDPTTRRRTVIYVCSTYVAGRCGGHAVSCGYQRITHEDAERLLLDKIKELNLPLEQMSSEGARRNLEERLARLGHADEESTRQFQQWLMEGINALGDYLVELYYREDDHYREIQKLRAIALRACCGDYDGKPDDYRLFGRVYLAEVRQAVLEAEEAAVSGARRKLSELREEHRRYTLAWAKASDDMQAVLKQEIERLEEEIRDWEPRTVPLTQRFNAIYAAEVERQAERERLLAEWPKLENREKGEAFRRLFKTVTLFWDREFHPASAKPTRPRKTARPGRYSYTLLRDRIQWAFTTVDLKSS